MMMGKGFAVGPIVLSESFRIRIGWDVLNENIDNHTILIFWHYFKKFFSMNFQKKETRMKTIKIFNQANLQSSIGKAEKNSKENQEIKRRERQEKDTGLIKKKFVWRKEEDPRV